MEFNRNNYIYDTVNGGFILLNFPDKEKKHGCRFNCPYCGFKHTKEYQKELYPSDAAIDLFLSYNRGLFIKLSGGGDPLYNYEENREKIQHLLDYITKKGRKIMITTREVDTVLKYYSNELSLIDNWSISVDSCQENVYNCLKALKDSGKSAMVSMVYTPGITSRETVKKVAEFYAPVTWRILIVNNYFYPYEENWINFGAELERLTNGIAKVKEDFTSDISILSLVGNEIKIQSSITDEIGEDHV